MKKNLTLNIKDLALLKSRPEEYYKKQLQETEKCSPQHIQELPYDGNATTEGKLNRRAEAIDIKIADEEKNIKDLKKELKKVKKEREEVENKLQEKKEKTLKKAEELTDKLKRAYGELESPWSAWTSIVPMDSTLYNILKDPYNKLRDSFNNYDKKHPGYVNVAHTVEDRGGDYKDDIICGSWSWSTYNERFVPYSKLINKFSSESGFCQREAKKLKNIEGIYDEIKDFSNTHWSGKNLEEYDTRIEYKQLKPLIDSEKDLNKQIKKSEKILKDLKEEKGKNDVRIDKLED